METFTKAFNHFKESGCFHLSNAELAISQLQAIAAYIGSSFVSSSTELPVYYEFHLNRVRLVSMVSGMETRANEKSIEEIEKILLELLGKLPWHSIRLTEISFSDNLDYYEPSQPFFSQLLAYLKSSLKTIKAIYLKSNNLSQEWLFAFLEQAKQLETLGLGLALEDSNFLGCLCEQLAAHPTLKTLDLAETSINLSAYDDLSKLLDTNYQIDNIILPMPTENDAVAAMRHEQLMRRLLRPGLARFKAEHFSQEKLLTLAEKALISGKPEHLEIIFSHTSAASLAPDESHAWLERACTVWPRVYQAHRAYLEKHWSVATLKLSEVQERDGTKSVGYYLLEMAFSLKDAEGIKILLRLGADLLEIPSDEESCLLTQLFQDKKQPAWKQVVIEHIRKDLSLLVPQALRLKPFFGVDARLKEIKSHLDCYLTTLLERGDSPVLMQLFRGVLFNLKDRQSEWEKAMRMLVVAVEKSVENSDVDYHAMNHLYTFSKELVGEARGAKRGWLGRSELNDKLECLGGKLKDEADSSKTMLHDRDVVKAADSATSVKEAEDAEKINTIKTLQEELSKTRKDKRAVEDVRLKEGTAYMKDKKERDQKIEAMRAEDRAEHEAVRKKDKVELEQKLETQKQAAQTAEAKRKKDKAEFEQKLKAQEQESKRELQKAKQESKQASRESKREAQEAKQESQESKREAQEAKQESQEAKRESQATKRELAELKVLVQQLLKRQVANQSSSPSNEEDTPQHSAHFFTQP